MKIKEKQRRMEDKRKNGRKNRKWKKNTDKSEEIKGKLKEHNGDVWGAWKENWAEIRKSKGNSGNIRQKKKLKEHKGKKKGT
jgi:hypothetical protein